MSLHVRRYHLVLDEQHTEAGRPVRPRVHRVVAAAVVANPWAGRGFVADLAGPVRAGCPALARDLMDRALGALPAGSTVAAAGKAVVVGADGEVEHGAALVHNPFFSDVVRDRVGGTSVLPSTEARTPPGAAVTVPLAHITHATDRDHYQGVRTVVPDAPHPAEVLVLVALSTGTRPAPRIGDRRTDPPFDPAPWRP